MEAPDDGKRALFDMARRPTKVTAALEPLRTLLGTTFKSDENPDANIREFNACLRDVQKTGVLDKDDIKQHVLSALDPVFYAAVRMDIFRPTSVQRWTFSRCNNARGKRMRSTSALDVGIPSCSALMTTLLRGTGSPGSRTCSRG